MEGITLFVSIVIIVFGILQIILFFKLWGMTNDVKKIKSSLPISLEGISPAKIEFAIGNKEKAKEMVKREFISDVHKIYREVLAYEYSQYQQERNHYDKGYKKLEAIYKNRFSKPEEYIDFTMFDTFDKANDFFK